MEELTQRVASWCRTGHLPDDNVFFSTMTESSGFFVETEGTYWDFKDEWPFSNSNEYFGGIARLICAFANTNGGMIVFGVHDSKRTGGNNKVQINLDRFCQALSNLIGDLPDISLKRYESSTSGNVDVLFVRRRENGTAPLRFSRSVGKYKPGVIWVRAGHEVVIASPEHFPILFCRADQSSGVDSAPELDGSMPPSPANMKRFVGRTEVLDRLFTWIETSDEPRTYLHGKGGSGKTTIAYEFARLVKDYGSTLIPFGGRPIDVVIFLSAKEKMLVSAEGRIADIEEPDFTNETDFLRQLLFYGEWTKDRDYLNNANLQALRSQALQFFDLIGALIIVDDVDTLTTKGIDPGSDFLYRTLCRSKRHSKVVYTLRNAPTQSITNSIEVPGLIGDEYNQFVRECAKQFSVPQPPIDFRDEKLPELSERRPLVIESVIALVRTAASYKRAAELFSQNAGDDVRNYVFIREWDALSRETLARLLLAVLSDLKEPSAFEELQTLLQADSSRIKDAIGAVREMFLQVDEAGNEALYSLNPLTRRFISSKKADLVGYGVLRERIKAFKRNIYISNPKVARLATIVERLLPSRTLEHSEDKANEAYQLMIDRSHPPAVTEDPLFRCFLGYVCVCLPRPLLGEAREAFKYATDMRYEPEFKFIRRWFHAERHSGIHDGWSLRVADIVIDGKRYDERDKTTMISWKASSLYARARERLTTDPVDGLKDLQDALLLHLRAYRLYCLSSDFKASASADYARNTAFQLFQLVCRSDAPWEISDRLKELTSSKEIFIDPLERPIIDAFDMLLASIHRPDLAQRSKNRMKGLVEVLSVSDRWLSAEALGRVTNAVSRVETLMTEKGRGSRS